MQSDGPAIFAKDLTRNFGSTRAVDGLNLEIYQGELFGLVGPDGAGKTTTLRTLAGLLDISSGSAQLAGVDLRRDPEAVKPIIGYMAQQFSLYGELTVLENLNFFAELYEIGAAELDARTERLLRFAGLLEFQGRRGDQLSGGMKKKLALACTLIHHPSILLLDEPTTGVDPISRREFWDILTDLHLEGTTILVSTPYMDEADRCSRIGLMYAGKLVVCDQPNNIREELRGEIIAIRVDRWQQARKVIAGVEGVLEVQTYGEAIHALVDSAQVALPRIEAALRAAGLSHAELRRAPARMEEAFISLIRALEAAPDPEEP
jgi:ABC-2 type transport system ATP-binding protein